MNASKQSIHGWRRVLDYTPLPDLRRGQWLSRRPGVYRLVPPWVYRHSRFYGFGHVAGGTVQAVAGLICLSYGVDGWAVFFLTLAALNLAGGIWDLRLDPSAAAPA